MGTASNRQLSSSCTCRGLACFEVSCNRRGLECNSVSNFCIERQSGIGICTGDTPECLAKCHSPTATMSCQAGRCIGNPVARTDCPQGCLVGETCVTGNCVVDTVDPTVTCPSLAVTGSIPANQQVTTVVLPDIPVDDNLDVNPVVLISPVDNIFSAGTTRVTVTALDDAGNMAEYTFNVEVEVTECFQWNEWSGSEYKLTSTWQSWEESHQLCGNYSGHLATIENKEENDFLQRMMADCTSAHYPWIWIGLNDRDAEGTWEWSDHTDAAYKNWYEGDPTGGETYDWEATQPNGGEKHDCVDIGVYSGKWYDWKCSYYFQAVCERKKSDG